MTSSSIPAIHPRSSVTKGRKRSGRSIQLMLVGLIVGLCLWSFFGLQYVMFETSSLPSASGKNENRFKEGHLFRPQPIGTTDGHKIGSDNTSLLKTRKVNMNPEIELVAGGPRKDGDEVAVVLDSDEKEQRQQQREKRNRNRKQRKKQKRKPSNLENTSARQAAGIDQYPDYNFVHRSPWETQQWRKRKRLSKELREMFPGPKEVAAQNNGNKASPTSLSHCQGKRLLDEIQIHTIGWRRAEGLANVLRQLEAADYHRWDQNISLFIHIDGNSTEEVDTMVKKFHWSHGPQHLDHRQTNIGLREMWLTSLRQAVSQVGNNTLLLVLEDDMVVSPMYFQWILSMIDLYARNPDCRDSNLIGFSLSPLVYQNMYKPFFDWVADKELRPFLPNGTRQAAFLASVPSSWGGLFFSDQWRRFDSFVTARIQPPFYYLDNERDPQNLDLTPAIFQLPLECATRSWTKSWKRFLVDWMYAGGYFMLYPNLPDFQGLAYPLQNSGVHVNDFNKDRYTVKLVTNASALEHVLTNNDNYQLPLYHQMKVLNLEHQVTSREILMALGTRFLNQISDNCEIEGCSKLLNQWTRDDWVIPKMGFPPFPQICVPDAYQSVATQAYRPAMITPSNKSSILAASQQRYLLLSSSTAGHNMVLARLWAKVLDRQLVIVAMTQSSNSTVDDFGKLNRRYQEYVARNFKSSSRLLLVSDESDPLVLTKTEFSRWSVKPWRMLRICSRNSSTSDSKKEDSFMDVVVSSASQVVDLHHIFDVNYNHERWNKMKKLLEFVQHLFGGCSDPILTLDCLLAPG